MTAHSAIGRSKRSEQLPADQMTPLQERRMLEQIGIDVAALQRLVRRHPVVLLDQEGGLCWSTI
jgi:hypothetical protein